MFEYVFISAFVAVGLVLASVLAVSFLRSRRDLSAGRAVPIRWSQDFRELPVSSRRCRHALTGEAPGRVCPNAFDCRVCPNHPNFRQTSAGEGPGMVFGLRYLNSRYYHRGHTWVAPLADGTVLIGLDAIGRQMIGRPDAVTIPGRGAKIVNNGEGWRMRKDGVEVRILSPIDGTVLETGGPDDDWYLKVRPATNPPDLRHLLRGEEVQPWVAAEIERLQCVMAPAGELPVLADGGVLVDEFIREIPAARRDEVLGAFFLDS